MTAPRIHIMGASGCGVSTLGRALAADLKIVHLDTDDFYWQPTDPPYQSKRDIGERVCKLNAALSRDGWVLSGALESWGQPILHLFDVVVFLEASTEVRLERLREREIERFGAEALAPSGYFHKNHEEFIRWAAEYESGTLPGRSRPRHEKWLATLPCSVLKLNSENAVEELKRSVLSYLRGPHRVASVMAGFSRPWYVAGGWALDLFLETVTRPHADIETLIFRGDQLDLQPRLREFALTKMIPGSSGGIEQPWLDGELLEPPVHQIRARSTGYEFDVFLAEADDDDWIYRRNHRVTRRRNEIGGASSLKIPFLSPEIVLLFKAKYLLAKDQADFARASPRLTKSKKQWLATALKLAHPDCPWISSLASCDCEE